MKKLFSHLLPLLLAITLLITAVPFTVAGEDNIASDKAVTIGAFESSAINTHTAKQVGEGSSMGLRLSYGAPFNKVTVCMPTWSTKDSAATLAFYKWNTDYETTIAGEPIADKRFEPLVDNAHNALTFEEQPAGEYLLVIKDVKGQNASYDLTAVQFAALGICDLYDLDTPGDLEFYAEVPDLPDATRFIENPMGNKIFMTKKVPDEAIAESLQEILSSF